ncbi:MAG TPA: PorT family protein [Desulfobacteraceae bacterium]|nr:PorT family protein [Desulfobacteraceae bacterium]
MKTLSGKYSVSFLLIILFAGSAAAQTKKPMNRSWYDEKPVHFGFSIGFNTMDFRLTPNQDYYAVDSLYPEVAALSPGINIQIIIDYHPADYWDIRFLPGVSFGQRKLNYYKSQEVYDDRQHIESSFLEFPLLLKYKGSRLNNVRPYLVGGLNFRHDLAGRKGFDDDKSIYVILNRSDLYYEFGAGLDFYLPYFKLAVEIKMSNGLRNVLSQQRAAGYHQYVDAIDKLKSQMWILAFHFE